MKNKIVVYYYRGGTIEWDTHLKLYLNGWEANPTTYIFQKMPMRGRPETILRKAIRRWVRITGLDPAEPGHNFGVMKKEYEHKYISLKTVKGAEVRGIL